MKRIGVLTSGGDAQGMNAAVRAVVRAGLDRGAEVYAIYEGYPGHGGGRRSDPPITWFDVGGILQQGGTVIGTARRRIFARARARLRAVANSDRQRHRRPGGHRRRRQPHRRRHLRAEWPELLPNCWWRRADDARRLPPYTRIWPSSGWSAPSTTTCGAPTSPSAPTARCTASWRRSMPSAARRPAINALCRRGDGAQFRLPGADERAGHRRRLGLDP
jgi:hypothetical protein